MESQKIKQPQPKLKNKHGCWGLLENRAGDLRAQELDTSKRVGDKHLQKALIISRSR